MSKLLSSIFFRILITVILVCNYSSIWSCLLSDFSFSPVSCYAWQFFNECLTLYLKHCTGSGWCFLPAERIYLLLLQGARDRWCQSSRDHAASLAGLLSLRRSFLRRTPVKIPARGLGYFSGPPWQVLNSGFVSITLWGLPETLLALHPLSVWLLSLLYNLIRK